VNEIIADIHRHRGQVARACDYDVKKLMEYYRRREKESAGAKHKLVSYAQTAPQANVPQALREEPPKK
jgi:hypothetical protein